jgi:hypothetical protein
MLDFIRPWATVRKMLAFAAAVDRLSVGPAEKGRPGGWAPGASAPPPHGPIAFGWGARQLVEVLLPWARWEALRGSAAGPPGGAARDSCVLLREVFAPFHHVRVSPSWLSANDRAAYKVAAGIDAEEAGCDNQ